jgi:hypothetical protein
MTRVNSLLAQRMQKPSNTSKMAEMAKQSATGHLNSFSGIFSLVELSPKEKENLSLLLTQYSEDKQDIAQDLEQLIILTCEVKAINHQAALLHGERIKKAHHIFTRYQEGAFTTWLITTYGNRQTPYNLMHYYEFYQAMPTQLRPQIEAIPRQAIYILASRNASLEEKKAIVKEYHGQTKAEMLTLIRQRFPLVKGDKREQQVGEIVIQQMRNLYKQLKEHSLELKTTQKNQMKQLLEELQNLLK